MNGLVKFLKMLGLTVIQLRWLGAAIGLIFLIAFFYHLRRCSADKNDRLFWHECNRCIDSNTVTTNGDVDIQNFGPGTVNARDFKKFIVPANGPMPQLPPVFWRDFFRAFPDTTVFVPLQLDGQTDEDQAIIRGLKVPFVEGMSRLGYHFNNYPPGWELPSGMPYVHVSRTEFNVLFPAQSRSSR